MNKSHGSHHHAKFLFIQNVITGCEGGGGETPPPTAILRAPRFIKGSAINPLLYVILYTPVTSKVVFPILHKVNRE